jgi:hypothetical protein
MRPGVETETLDYASTSVIPTDVSQGLAVGVTESGPSVPSTDNNIRNMDEYETVYAPTGEAYLPGQLMYRAANEFFRQGGAGLYVGRVAGAAAVKASVDVPDNAAGIVLEATAKGVGEWGNDLDLTILLNAQNPDIPVTAYRINVLRNGEVLESSPDILSTEGAITWSNDSGYIEFDGGTSVILPKNGTYSLTGGLNDVAGINNTTWQAGLDSLDDNLGPGMLMMPGITTDTLHQAAAAAAENHARIFIGDHADTDVVATLIAASKAVTVNGARSRFSGLFAPWLLVPGRSANSVVKVAPSAAVAGRFSKNMSLGMSANEPTAGDNGVLSNVLGFSQTWSATDRQNLNANGVNLIRDKFGDTKIYGWRTTADPINDKKWLALSNSILHSQIMALASEQGERFLFRQIDGGGHLIGRFQSALIGHVCMPLYTQGALYGNTPSEAYKVDVGPNINTPTTIANNELHAVISVRSAPFGELVKVAIVKYLITETIPA